MCEDNEWDEKKKQNKTKDVLTSTFLLLVLQRKTILDLQCKKIKIQAPGTTLLTFIDKVRYEGGHEKCCRFGTLTGVHQGAHIRSSKFWPARNGRALAGKRNVLRKKTVADVLPLALLSGLFLCLVG